MAIYLSVRVIPNGSADECYNDECDDGRVSSWTPFDNVGVQRVDLECRNSLNREDEEHRREQQGKHDLRRNSGGSESSHYR